MAAVASFGASACATPEGGPEAGPSPTPSEPPEPALELLATVPAPAGAAYAVTGEMLVVALPDGDDPGQVVAYRLSDGEEVWRNPLPADRVRGAMAVGERVLVDTEARIDCPEGAPPPQCADREVTAFAAADGARLWSHPENLPYVAAGDEVLQWTWFADPSASGSDFFHAGHRVDTNEHIWTESTSGGTQEASYHSPSFRTPVTARHHPSRDTYRVRWVTITRAIGVVDVVDPVTGELRVLESAGPPFTVPGTTVVGDLLLAGQGEELVAYSLIDLAERWRIPDGRPTDCGVLVCVTTGEVFEDSDVRAVEADTGRVRWSRQVDGYPVVGLASPDMPDGPLLSYSWSGVHRAEWEPDWVSAMCDEFPDQPQSCSPYDVAPQVLSPVDGEVLLDLPGWRVVGVSGPWLALVRGPHGAAYLPGGEATFAVADLERLTLTELGTLPELIADDDAAHDVDANACRVSGSWLTCRHPDDSITVWRFRGAG